MIEVNHGTGEAVAREEGEAAIKYSNGMQAETAVRVAKVARVELAQANVMLSVEDPPEHGGARVRLRMFLRDQQEEMLPIYQYEGVNLIRQNVKVDCSSSHPGVVEAYGEVSDLEGYFCNVRYVGSASAANDNLYHKNTPKTVTVSVHVSSSTPNVARYSLDRFTSFQVKLNSKIYVENRCANGVHLDKDKRSTVVGVVSLSDFSIQSPFKSSELIVEKSRESLDSNHFSVTVRVPVDHNTPLSQNLVLKSAVNDATVASIPITFSPTHKAKKVASSPATPREEQKQATYNIDTKARRPASSAEESSQWTQWILLIFLLILGLFAASSSTEMVSQYSFISFSLTFAYRYLQQLERVLASLLDFFLRLFGINKGRDHSQDLSRSYYSTRADLANRSFGHRSTGNYSLVRDTNKNRGQMSP